jgi:hypothetical protein
MSARPAFPQIAAQRVVFVQCCRGQHDMRHAAGNETTKAALDHRAAVNRLERLARKAARSDSCLENDSRPRPHHAACTSRMRRLNDCIRTWRFSRKKTTRSSSSRAHRGTHRWRVLPCGRV